MPENGATAKLGEKIKGGSPPRIQRYLSINDNTRPITERVAYDSWLGGYWRQRKYKKKDLNGQRVNHS